MSSASAAENDTIYVNNSHGNDSWDGLTWETAKSTIKNATETVNNGGTVNIGEGTYSGAGNTNIIITKDMTINGAGIDKTIIDGSSSNQIFLINSGTVNINNLTITNGTSLKGGGICNYGTLTINQCKFTNCTTHYMPLSGGSAIYSDDGCTLTVKNSIFTNNDARSSQTYGATILSCGPLIVENSDFIGNQAFSGGAISILYDINAIISGCNFINNTALKSGGALCIYSDKSTVSINSSSFVGNTAQNIPSTNNIDNLFYSNLDISSNWWGTNTGVDGVDGAFTCNNWIYMTLTGNSPINYGEKSTITANFNNLSDGTVVIPYNTHMPDGNSVIFSTDQGSVNPTQSVTKDGLVQTILTGANGGTANVTAKSGTQLLSVTITINQASTQITVNNTTGINNQTTNLTATLTDQNGNPLSDKTIEFNINGTSIGTATTNNQGIATLQYTITQTPGTHTITANFPGDSNYTSSTGTGTLTVYKTSTQILVNNSIGTNNGTTNLTATLTDINGTPIKDKTVNFTINGTSVGTGTTDSNGIATLTYKLTKAGDFVLTASFAGDGDYLTSTGSGKLHVDPSANLYMDPTTSNNNPLAGQEFQITYKLGNYGPDAAENVTITFTLPEGLEYVDLSADSGICSYDPTTRIVTWKLLTVPQGDPYLYLTVRGTSAGTYILTPTISTSTYNWKTGNQGILNIHINPVKSSDNSANTVNAATQTVAMQNTGANPIGLVLAILTILGGTLVPRKK